MRLSQRGVPVSGSLESREVSTKALTRELGASHSGFAELLQEMKDRAAMTVPELAARMGVAPNAVHQYFYKKRGVGGTSTMRWFLRYAEACGCQVTLTFPDRERRSATPLTRGTAAADLVARAQADL